MTRRPARFARSSLSALVLSSGEHCARLDSKQEIMSLILLQYKQECYQHPGEKTRYRQDYKTNSDFDDNLKSICHTYISGNIENFCLSNGVDFLISVTYSYN